MNTDIELKNHLICEFLIHKTSPSVLLESRGVVNGIDEVVDAFMIAFKEQIENTFTYLEITQTYKHPSILNGINTFFKNFNITITTRKNSKLSYNGGSQPNSIKFDEEKKVWYCVPEIVLMIDAPDIKRLTYGLSFALSHELTHCYNLLQYAIKTGQDPWYSINKNRYFDIRKDMVLGVGNEKAFANVLYYLNRMERNAYLAQLKQELMSVKIKMANDKEIFKLIKSTESYKKFKYLEKQINIIINDVTNVDVQNQIINHVNTLMNKKFSNYNQLKRYFINRWNKWKKNYLIKATKIAYDVYETTNHGKWFDWGSFNADDADIKS